MKNYISEGVSIICDLHNVSNNKLNNLEYLESIMLKACELSGATILGINKFKFDPAGVTIIITLSESHFSIHTYVDVNSKNNTGITMLDGFTCGNCSPEIGVTYIINQLCDGNENAYVDIKTFKRGMKRGIIDLGELCEIMCD